MHASTSDEGMAVRHNLTQTMPLYLLFYTLSSLLDVLLNTSKDPTQSSALLRQAFHSPLVINTLGFLAGIVGGNILRLTSAVSAVLIKCVRFLLRMRDADGMGGVDPSQTRSIIAIIAMSGLLAASSVYVEHCISTNNRNMMQERLALVVCFCAAYATGFHLAYLNWWRPAIFLLYSFTCGVLLFLRMLNWIFSCFAIKPSLAVKPLLIYNAERLVDSAATKSSTPPPIPMIECGCCFEECVFDNMLQCPDGHLFCQRCVQAQAKESIGKQDSTIRCMDASVCHHTFAPSVLKQCLDEKSFNLWQEILQVDVLAEANIQGLEKCPKCNFAIIFEVNFEHTPQLKCHRADCGFISCRKCKEKEHGKSDCKDPATLEAEHAIEEAMSGALMRKCPGCQIPFVKTEGCNRITCHKCKKMSCYICRQIVTSYDHFIRGGDPERDRGKTCRLFDGKGDSAATEERHQREVTEAERMARQASSSSIRSVGSAGSGRKVFGKLKRPSSWFRSGQTVE